MYIHVYIYIYIYVYNHMVIYRRGGAKQVPQRARRAETAPRLCLQERSGGSLIVFITYRSTFRKGGCSGNQV